jgi:hypothetical protein
MDYSQLSVSDGTGEAVIANIESDRAIASVTIDVDSVDNFPPKFIAASGTKLASNYIDPSTMTIFYGHLDGGDIIIDGFAPGYVDDGNTTGQIVVIKPNTFWADELVELAKVVHEDDGTLKDDVVDTDAIVDDAVDHTKIANGAVVQQVSAAYTGFDTTNVIMPWDNTIPQNTEGKEFMSLAITPKSATNVLVIEVLALTSNGNATQVHTAAIFQDAIASALAANAVFTDANTVVPKPLEVKHRMVAGTTSATTFKVRIGPHQLTTLTFNGNAGANILGAIPKSIITITEYKAA